MGAFLIDSLVTFAVYWALFFLFAERKPEDFDQVDTAVEFKAKLTLGDDTWGISGGKALLFFALFFLAGFLYWVVLPGLRGYTLGKLATSIRVVDRAGRCPAGVGRNALRQLVWIADDFPYFIPALTGFIVASTSEGNRRIGDIAAGTYVVRKEAVGTRVADIVSHLPTAPPPAVQPSPPPGWHPDPSGQARLRWWDGARWTDETSA